MQISKGYYKQIIHYVKKQIKFYTICTLRQNSSLSILNIGAVDFNIGKVQGE